MSWQGQLLEEARLVKEWPRGQRSVWGQETGRNGVEWNKCIDQVNDQNQNYDTHNLIVLQVWTSINSCR